MADPAASNTTRGEIGRRRRRRRVASLATVVTLTAAIGITPFTLRHHVSAEATPPVGDIEGQSLPPVPATPDVRFPLGSWQVGRRVFGGIEGYAGRMSVLPGDRLAVYVRTRARNYSATVYRMGYYRGAGANLMMASKSLAGTQQPLCPVEARGMVECRWRKSFSLAVQPTWPSGVYLIKLSASDSSESFVPFVVRESTPTATILFQVSVTTWEAYNTWGGRDLYQGPCPRKAPGPIPSSPPGASASPTPTPKASSPTPSPSPSPTPILSPVAFVRRVSPQASGEGRGCAFANRARAVSFDRPYTWPGTGQFLRFEYPMLYWLESKGYHVAYATDTDLHEGTDALASRQIFIAAGHDEYYSREMRRALESALTTGTSLIFMGADDIYRHIRFEASPLGADRVVVNYKVAGEDPFSITDPQESTGQWREWPLHDPEQLLLGAQYECNPVSASWVPTGRPAWLFHGTGLVAGRGIPRLVGYEYDKTFSDQGQPAGVIDVARSPLTCSGRQSESDSTFYVAPSGAGVFDAGTLELVCALGPTSHACQSVPPDTRIQKMMANLVEAMRARKFT